MSLLKIALFGGSFDPVHKGHLSLANYAQQAVGLDQVIFIPCAQSPHKLTHNYTADKHRLAMLQLATQSHDWATVSDYELTLAKKQFSIDSTATNPSYSIHTIEHFISSLPQAQLYWIMGQDQWDQIHTWYEYEKILGLVTLIIYPRQSSTSTQEIDKQASTTNVTSLASSHIYLDKGANLPLSSTDIRTDFSNSQSQLATQVFEYASTQKLYL